MNNTDIIIESQVVNFTLKLTGISKGHSTKYSIWLTILEKHERYAETIAENENVEWISGNMQENKMKDKKWMRT